jgi:hypothetical protein
MVARKVGLIEACLAAGAGNGNGSDCRKGQKFCCSEVVGGRLSSVTAFFAGSSEEGRQG